MIELYYDTEKPLPLDFPTLCRKVMARSEDEKEAVKVILDEFFQETEDGFRNSRCDKEISDASIAMIEAEDRRLNERERQRRNRERRADLFAKLREFDEVPPWNSTTEHLMSRVEYHMSRVTATDESSTYNVCTQPDTATHYPLPIYHLPDTNNQEDKKHMSYSDDVRACPVGSIVDLYHELMPNNPRVRVLNENRKSLIRARWREAATLECSPFGYKTKAEGLAAWRTFFEICSNSPFLIGLSKPQPDRPAFIADIDFIFKPSKFASILENKYHRE